MSAVSDENENIDAEEYNRQRFIALSKELFADRGVSDLHWQMTFAERCAILGILGSARPRVAIEIGTSIGGFLSVLSEHCERVYSLDVDASCRERLAGRFNNVEFLTGPSADTLPPLLKRLQAEKAPLGFILVDGDHTEAGVRADLEAILDYTPCVPLYVFMHDSFNPFCRRGMESVDWARNPHVDLVELDLVGGILHERPLWKDQMWGGLGLARLMPEPRNETLVVGKALNYLHETVFAVSKHNRGAAGTRKPQEPGSDSPS